MRLALSILVDERASLVVALSHSPIALCYDNDQETMYTAGYFCVAHRPSHHVRGSGGAAGSIKLRELGSAMFFWCLDHGGRW